MTDLSRRKVLSAGVAAGVSGLAGCLDSLVEADDEEQSAEDNDGTDQDTSSGIQITNVETETVDSACRTDEKEDSESTIEGESVEITGTLFTSNPCHVATANASVSGSTLSVAVGAEPEEDETECSQCLGRLEYQIQVSLSEAGIETVDVSHPEGSEQASGSGGTSDTTSRGTEDDIGMTVQAVETQQSTCESREERVTADREDGTLTLGGVIQAPNPCHETIVDSITTTDGMRTVNVGVESTLGDDEVCQQCVAHLAYQVTLSGVETASDSEIRVQHSSGFSTTV